MTVAVLQRSHTTALSGQALVPDPHWHVQRNAMGVTLAITIHDNAIATVADYAERILILNDHAELDQAVASDLTGQDLQDSLRTAGVTILLCGAISCRLIERLTAAGIAVADGWTGPVDAVLTAYRQGGSEDPGLRLPCRGPAPESGLCRRRRHRRGWR